MIQQIPLSKIVPHPHNPRRKLCEETVEGIKEQIIERGSFDPAHALKVRPLSDGNFQVVSGHQRAESARRAAVTEVPCIVAKMDDATALWELLLNNAQSELSPLDIGTFLMATVPKAKGGRGKSGGLAAVARKMGKSEQSLGDWVCAARVAAKLPDQSEGLSGYLVSLAIIHRCSESMWAELAQRMLNGAWSKEQTMRYVTTITSWNLPEDLAEVIPESVLLTRFFQTHEFSGPTLADVIRTIRSTDELIRSYAKVIDADTYIRTFRGWLKEQGAQALSTRAIHKYGMNLTMEFERVQDQQRFHLGDWRDHVNELIDESITLALFDPPFGIGLKPDRRVVREQHDVIVNDDDVETACAEVEACMRTLYSKLKTDAHVLCCAHWRNEPAMRLVLEAAGYTLRGRLIWNKGVGGLGDIHGGFAPMHETILHFVKGNPRMWERPGDVFDVPRIGANSKHPTEKPVELLRRLIKATTVEHDLIADPFAGIASVAVAAKQLRRSYWCTEIVEKYFQEGARRLEVEGQVSVITPAPAA